MGLFSSDNQYELYLGNAQKVLSNFHENSVDLVVTSPPYNVGKEYETKISIENYLETQESILKELERILSPTGSICWQVGNYVKDGEVFPLDIYYYQIFKKLGMRLRNRIIWHFGHGLHASKRFSGRYETILWFTKSDKYRMNYRPLCFIVAVSHFIEDAGASSGLTLLHASDGPRPLAIKPRLNILTAAL